MKKITLDDLEYIAMGSTVLGAGGEKPDRKLIALDIVGKAVLRG